MTLNIEFMENEVLACVRDGEVIIEAPRIETLVQRIKHSQVMSVRSVEKIVIDLNNKQIRISDLIPKRKNRVPLLKLGAYRVTSDIVMVPCDYYDGQKSHYIETMYYQQNQNQYDKLADEDEVLQDLLNAFDSISVLKKL